MPRAVALSRYVRQSPRKLRAVADLVRGLNVEKALDILHFSVKRPAIPVEKALRSAIANFRAAEPASARTEELFVESIAVDEGPTLKRYRPRAMGRATQILKRSSHLKVVLATKGDQSEPQES